MKENTRYECICALETRLAKAVKALTAAASVYDGDGPCYIGINEIAEEHGIDAAYALLLVSMIREQGEFEADLFGDELVLFRPRIAASKESRPTQAVVDLVASYEVINGTPDEDCLTRYFANYGAYVVKDGVSDLQLYGAYFEALPYINMTDQEYRAHRFVYRGEVETRMRCWQLENTLFSGDKVVFVPPVPTSPEGQFRYELGKVTDVSQDAQNCVVAFAESEMTIPLRHVLAIIEAGVSRNAFGFENAVAVLYLPDSWAADFLHEARREYERQQTSDPDEDESPGMTM